MTNITDQTAIRLEGVGKRYDIACDHSRESFPRAVLRLLTGTENSRPLWALNGIDLTVRRGETVGVVGSNGAGKSTLLLMMAGIIEPTLGRVSVSGQTNLFFQASSGLQPRLSVLDNLWVCAALQGLPRAEFRRRLPEIIEYSGLGDYLDARYGELSTGMAARLPFSVAVHGAIDIVLADEMLTVGDESFRERCMQTFTRLRAEGRTIVLATHDEALVARFCTRALFIEGGRIRRDGAVAGVLEAYALSRTESARAR